MEVKIKIIAHRGNLSGPSELENLPEQIDKCLAMNFDCEVDIWVTQKNILLGHDFGEYDITFEWLHARSSNLWIHCKNLEAAIECWAYHSFCHNEDPFTYTTTGKIWLHDLSMKIDENVIIPLIDIEDLKKEIDGVPYAICTDYPHLK